MATHVVAAACFDRLRKASPAGDLFTVLRQRDTVTVPRDDLARDVAAIRDKLRAMEMNGKVVLGDVVRVASGGDIIERALRAFTGFHATTVLSSRDEGIAICDTNLLFYYQNRLAGHGVAWDVIAPPGAPMSLSSQPGSAPRSTPAPEARSAPPSGAGDTTTSSDGTISGGAGGQGAQDAGQNEAVS
jgi:glycerol-3-phosphate O-acyltransferase